MAWLHRITGQRSTSVLNDDAALLKIYQSHLDCVFRSTRDSQGNYTLNRREIACSSTTAPGYPVRVGIIPEQNVPLTWAKLYAGLNIN